MGKASDARHRGNLTGGIAIHTPAISIGIAKHKIKNGSPRFWLIDHVRSATSQTPMQKTPNPARRPAKRLVNGTPLLRKAAPRQK